MVESRVEALQQNLNLRERVKGKAQSIITEFGQSFSQVKDPLKATRKVFCYGAYHWLSESIISQSSQKVILIEKVSKNTGRRSEIVYIIGSDNIIGGWNGREIPEQDLHFALNHLNVIGKVLHNLSLPE